jgi:hypothetical protein
MQIHHCFTQGLAQGTMFEIQKLQKQTFYSMETEAEGAC